MCNWGFAIAAVMKQTARGHFTHVVTYVDIHIRTMCNWGFVTADQIRHDYLRHIHVVTYVETHIRTMCNWGFAIADMIKRGDLSAE